MKRIEAFTLVELIVAMVLSTIVIAMAYQVYQRTEISFYEASDQTAEINNLLQLQNLLNNDCNNARLITYEDRQMKVERTSYHTVNYTIADDMVIRETQVAVDTFAVGSLVTSATYLFDKPPVLEHLRIHVQTGSNITYTLTAQVFYSNRVKFEHYLPE